mmetsp:Transcript_29397/g.75232  ORF Transcript_29397/g.75232 Transcript_29397/m.75232 type:complete len:220 (+) Transcript_29397:1048-1707(+)
MSLGRTLAVTKLNTAAATSAQSCFFCSVVLFSGSTAVCDAEPGSAMPKASTALAMVQAVNIAEHVPDPGRATHSIRCSSSMSISRSPYAPMASMTVPGSDRSTVPSGRGTCPGRAAPPNRLSPMQLSRGNTMVDAGTDLSHPARVIMASAAYPSCMISIQSAMYSREIKEYRMANAPCVMPSEITGVYAMWALPPSCSTSRAIKSANSTNLLLHGMELL